MKPPSDGSIDAVSPFSLAICPITSPSRALSQCRSFASFNLPERKSALLSEIDME
jgi:hypothetical protein